MDTNKNFYITTTLPYVNADPHIGFAMEIIRADVIARAKKLEGYEVFFNTGTDEHGQKIFEAAEKAGKSPQEYVDAYATRFKDLQKVLGITSDIHFIRTTDPGHIRAAEEMWRRVDAAGYIYKKNYKIKYCVACEEEKTESQIINGRCELHQDRELEIIEEENYFFKYSEFTDRLLKFYDEHPDFIIPTARMNEMREFIKRGLQDFSISRLKSKMSWGIAVPGDPDHVMYVWFDALTSYISTLGWPHSLENFEKFWTQGNPVQYCGKDNTRFQGLMWQAMLMAADLPNSVHIVVDGFINSGGQKMSKSIGNVVNPFDLVHEYGTDALRYYVLRELSPFEDSDYTEEKFKEAYNANLANGLGNLVARVMKMATSYGVVLPGDYVFQKDSRVEEYIKSFDLKSALDLIWVNIMYLDGFIQKKEPFKKIKINPEEAKDDLSHALRVLMNIAEVLMAFLPNTSAKIKSAIKENKMPETLFPRKD